MKRLLALRTFEEDGSLSERYQSIFAKRKAFQAVRLSRGARDDFSNLNPARVTVRSRLDDFHLCVLYRVSLSIHKQNLVKLRNYKRKIGYWLLPGRELFQVICHKSLIQKKIRIFFCQRKSEVGDQSEHKRDFKK